MSLRQSLSIVGLVVAPLFAFGCASADGASTASSNGVTLTGRIGGGSVSTKTIGNVNVSRGGVHIAARELYKRGGVGRNVDVAVESDGTFHVDVERGSRYVVTVDDSEGKSAIVVFGDGESAVSVGAGNGHATVDVGNVHVTGGEAHTDVRIDGKFGLQSTLAQVDDVFLAADGAILEAMKAVEEAKKAADEALKAAQEAQAQADDALKAAEEARKKAGL